MNCILTAHPTYKALVEAGYSKDLINRAWYLINTKSFNDWYGEGNKHQDDNSPIITKDLKVINETGQAVSLDDIVGYGFVTDVKDIKQKLKYPNSPFRSDEREKYRLFKQEDYKQALAVAAKINTTWDNVKANVERAVGEKGDQRNYFRVVLYDNFNKDEAFQQREDVKEVTKQWDKQLDDKMKSYLNKLGISYEGVKAIYDKATGEEIPAIAVADMVNKVVKVVEGKAGIDTLPEETAHFFVKMIEGSPLYNSMYNEITNFDVYKEVVNDYSELYKGNDKQLREEAIGKMISQQIVNQFEDAKKDRADRWWNRVWKLIKEKVLGIDSKQLQDDITNLAPFSDAAKQILEEQKVDRRETNPSFLEEKSEQEYYQLDKQDKIVKAITDTQIALDSSTDKYFYMENGNRVEVSKRVSDRVKEANIKRGFGKFSEAQKEKFTKYAIAGTRGHADLANIIDRITAEKNGQLIPSKTNLSGENVYNILENWMKDFISKFPAGTKFLSEQSILDKAASEAGTMDLLAISPEGVVDIYDFKFINFENKTEIPWNKEEDYNIQLGRYKQILKERYGVKEFGKLRILPVAATYSEQHVLKSIEVNKQIVPLEGKKAYLNPLPMFDEMTGNEDKDRLLQVALKDRERLLGMHPKTAEETEYKQDKLKRINKAIKEIQLTGNIKEFINNALYTLNKVRDTGFEKLDGKQFHAFQDELTFYSNYLIDSIGDEMDKLDKDTKDAISKVVSNSQLMLKHATKEVSNRLKGYFGDDIETPQKESGLWTRMFRTLSQQNHPKIAAFYKLVQKSIEKTRKAHDELNDNIRKTVDALKEFQKGKGITGTDVFNYMLTKNNKGGWDMISKFNPESYKTLNSYREKGGEDALSWIKKNMTFNQTAYNETLNEKKRIWKDMYKFDDDAVGKFNERVKQFENKYGNNDKGLINNKDNKFLSFKDDHLSKEYKNIYATGNEALKNFYELFHKTSSDFQDYTGLTKGGEFVWNISNDLIDSIGENGFGVFKHMSSVWEQLEANKSAPSIGMVDPTNGEKLKKIPVYYAYDNYKIDKKTGDRVIDNSAQSKDLGRVLSLVGAMAYNHKHMEEIEGTARMLEKTLALDTTIVTDGNGNPIVNTLTGKVQTAIGSATNLESLQDFMNYYLYGIKMKTKDYAFNFFGHQLSMLKSFNMLSNMYTTKSIAMNPISIISNAVGGNLNARIMGARSKFYSNTQYTNAMYNLIARRDSKSMALMGYFDLAHGQDIYKKAISLSVSALTKNLTYDKLFIGQLAPEANIRNSVLLGMLQAHTLENGKIVKITDEKKGATSLLDHIEIKDGNLDFKGISDQELTKFRNRALNVGDDLLGNNTRDDIRAVHLSMMGRALMTFRNWIPRMLDERYGELRYNQNLEEYELGRYRSFWNQVVNKQIHKLAFDMIKGFGVFGYAGKFGNVTVEHAKRLYEEAIAKEPGLADRMTEDQYVQLHLENLRANMMEIYLVAGMVSLLAAAKPDDDDKDNQSSLNKYLVKQLDRNQSELLFFYNPQEFNRILKSPIPITNLLRDYIGLTKAIAFETAEGVTGKEDITKKNEIPKYAMRVLPVLNGFESILSYINEDYDKTDPRSK